MKSVKNQSLRDLPHEPLRAQPHDEPERRLGAPTSARDDVEPMEGEDPTSHREQVEDPQSRIDPALGGHGVSVAGARRPGVPSAAAQPPPPSPASDGPAAVQVLLCHLVMVVGDEGVDGGHDVRVELELRVAGRALPCTALARVAWSAMAFEGARSLKLPFASTVPVTHLAMYGNVLGLL